MWLQRPRSRTGRSGASSSWSRSASGCLRSRSRARAIKTVRLDGLGPVRRLLEMGRHGLAVLHAPGPAAVAAFFQTLGWVCQLFAVYVAMRAFDITLRSGGRAGAAADERGDALPALAREHRSAAGGDRSPLRQYGVPAGQAIAFGFGLQAIEASVGVGVGLMFLAREGLSSRCCGECPTLRRPRRPTTRTRRRRCARKIP